MKLAHFSSLMRGVALSVMVNAAMPVAEAWAAEEVQVLRRAPSGNGMALPFTTFQLEEQALAQSVPCKWISKDGRVGPSYGGGRYDFLCKGGDFATVNLYLDKADSSGNGVGKVRLMYREWNSAMNPNAGEARIALQFLQHVTGRFVPAAAAGQVLDTFWGQTNRKWTQDGVEITFDLEKGDQFNVRKLTLAAKGKVQALGPVMTPAGAGLAKPGATPLQMAPVRGIPGVAPTQPQGTQVYMETPTGEKKPVPAVVPVDAGLTRQPMIPQGPSIVLPTPAGVLPVPGVGGRALGDMLVVPPTAPAGPKPEQPGQLQQATPAELNTAPAPESLVTPTAPVPLSATLVPTTQDLTGVQTKAPSNFDIYNKATELTKDIEKRAHIAKVEDAKVTASKPVTPTLMVTPSSVVVPALKPVPTPGEAGAAAGEGLGAGVAAPVAATPAVDQVGQPTNYQGPRSSEVRPLPQLKFVPKAEPLKGADDVLQFEDEKSRL